MKKWTSGIMLALILVGAVWAESTQTGDWIVDESISAPQDVQIAPYEGKDGSSAEAGYMLLEWTPVEGATSYRIFRQRSVSYRLATPEDDTEDAIVPLEVPELVWVPWAKSDVIPDAEKVRVVVATLDNVASAFAVSTVVEKDGTVFLSPLALANWMVTPPDDGKAGYIGSDFDQDSQVNFADFFLFADHFGTQSGDPNWDRAYDLDDNGKVDFDDFFLFADHFGTSDPISWSGDVGLTGDFEPDSTAGQDLINVNTATLEELETLPGIGPILAQRIIDGRPYESVDDLLGVDGIGEKRLEDIRGLVTVE